MDTIDKLHKLGKYTVIEQIGDGNFGWVFKASDNLDRNVAIKVLKPCWADDPLALERFRREALITSHLYHNRIATIVEFDESEGRRFLVMRYVDGVSLDALIKKLGHLSWRQSLEIISQVAEGLDYAHQRGFIHRDITLNNIMISKTDGAVLTDFGLGRVAAMSRISSSGVVLGTPYYIAPETWNGKPASPATDVYSLACLASEMLSGQVLFSGQTTPEIMTKHILNSPKFPVSWPEDVPPGITAVLTNALEKDPANRCQTAGSFVSALKNLAFEQAPASAVLPQVVSTAARPVQTRQVSLENTQPVRINKGGHIRNVVRLGISVLGLITLLSLGIIFKIPVDQAMASNTTSLIAQKRQAANIQIVSTGSPPTGGTLQSANSIPNYTIGSTLVRENDGSVMVYVPEGPFIMGSNPAAALAECAKVTNDCQKSWFIDEGPSHVVNLDSFWIDQTEVTNAKYAICVQAGNCNLPINLSSASHPNYYENLDFANYPVINVDWNQANLYCNWAGGRLPDEAEWEKAARGQDGWMYPWGDNANKSYANFDGTDTSQVGSYINGKSTFGALDMAGNVWEWTAERYDAYPQSNTGVSSDYGKNYRVVRGGSWVGSFNDIRAANRDWGIFSQNYSDLGFRCAYNAH